MTRGVSRDCDAAGCAGVVTSPVAFEIVCGASTGMLLIELMSRTAAVNSLSCFIDSGGTATQ